MIDKKINAYGKKYVVPIKPGENSFEKRLKKLSVEKNFSLTPEFPKNALVEVSNACNHSCLFCTNPRMVRKINTLDFNIYTKFIDEAVELGLEEIGLYATGEPFMVKKINDYILYAKRKKLKYIYLTSNGSIKNQVMIKKAIDSGLNSIKFSINAGNKNTYKLIHGKDDFQTVINNIKFIDKYRKDNNLNLKLYVSFVVTKYTLDEKNELYDLLKDYIDEIAYYDVNTQMGQNLDIFDKFSLNNKSILLSVPENGRGKPCAMLWNRIHVTCEGYLDLCCNDYENVLTYSDLKHSSLKDSWTNSVIQEMRKMHLEQKLENTLCQNCIYNTSVDVVPISKLGYHEGKQVYSDKKSGIDFINARIEKLEELK